MSDPVNAATGGLTPAAHGLSPIDLFTQADTVVKAVIIILVLASLWGWLVIVDKVSRIGVLNRRATRLIASIQKGVLPVTSVAESFAAVKANDPFVTVYKALIDEYNLSTDLLQTEAQRDALQDRVHRAGQLASGKAITDLQSSLSGLATIGAVAPFVGLFGTVWGIRNSFQGIAASNNTSLAVVAPGIAEALFATALGLVAAIPAVVFYNRIGTAIGGYGKKLNNFIGVFEIELSRHLSNKGERGGLRVA